MRTTFRVRLAAMIGALAIAAGGMLLAGAPASAGPNCPAGYHCVMKDNINDNERHDYFNSDSNFTNDTFAGGVNVNDQVSAASNSSTGGFESHYYRNAGYNTFLFCVNPGSFANTLPGGVNDQASSLMLRPTTPISCF